MPRMQSRPDRSAVSERWEESRGCAGEASWECAGGMQYVCECTCFMSFFFGGDSDGVCISFVAARSLPEGRLTPSEGQRRCFVDMPTSIYAIGRI